jgi:hypothetical protein
MAMNDFTKEELELLQSYVTEINRKYESTNMIEKLETVKRELQEGEF